MHTSMIIGSVIIVILITLCVFYTTYKFGKKISEEDNLNGFWKADPIFCQEAGLHSFIVRIDNDAGYILAFNDDGVIINNTIHLDISEGPLNKLGLGDNSSESRQYEVVIDWLGETCESIPSELTFYYYPQYGKLVFAKNDGDTGKIYVVLYKDYSMSDVVRKLPFDSQ